MPGGESRNLILPDSLLKDESEREVSWPRHRWLLQHSRRTVTFAVLGIVGLGLLGLRSWQHRGVLWAAAREEISEFDSSRCSEYPSLEFAAHNAVLHNNLANKGPHHGGGEGIVYRATESGGAGKDAHRKLLIVVNATSSNYHPFVAHMNGMQGDYGSINLMSGSSIDLVLRFYDETTSKRVSLAEAAFTFYDLDTGLHGRSVESVTIGGFSKYHITKSSEVRVEEADGNRTRFSASTYGTGKDNPTDPMLLTQQQKDRAVTLMFEDLQQLELTLAAGPGKGPRFFTFVAKPSLLCAATKEEGTAAIKDRSLAIQKTSKIDVTGSTIKSAPDTPEDNEKPENAPAKPENKSDKLPNLVARPPLQTAIVVGQGETFSNFFVELGNKVAKGDVLFLTQNGDAVARTYEAPLDGEVVAIQDKLKENDDLDKRLDNRTVIVLRREPFAALGPINEHNHRAAVAREGSIFVAFKVQVGDVVRQHDPIAVLKDAKTSALTFLRAPQAGLITGLQSELQAGQSIDRIKDRNLATIGQFPPLNRAFKEEYIECTELGAEFLTYEVREGDTVQDGNIIAFVKTVGNPRVAIRSHRAGVVRYIHRRLKKGMRLDIVLPDKNLATLGPLPALKLGPDEVASNAPAIGEWVFQEWVKNVGDEVMKDDPVALLKNKWDGRVRAVFAERGGVVTKRVESLRKGDIIQRDLADRDLAAIGLFPEPKLGPGEHAVQVPHMDDIFDFFFVKAGQTVQQGDPVVQVTIPSRRLAAEDVHTRRLQLNALTIPSPVSGVVSYITPLKAGGSIGSQSKGPTIAKIEVPSRWWIFFTCAALLAGCCLLGAIFMVLRGHSEYRVVGESPAPAPVESKLMAEPDAPKAVDDSNKCSSSAD